MAASFLASKYHSNLYAVLEREMGEKLDLDDAGSSAYVVFGSMLGLCDAGCACMGCGEDGADLACLASHPRRRTLGFITSNYLLHKMVTKHTQFLKRIQETFRRCSQDIYVAAIATSFAPRVVQVDELGLD